jgi:hypothetical protein
MALLGSTATVAARAGRKLNNGLTLEFKTSATDTLATAVQKGSVGTVVVRSVGHPGDRRKDATWPYALVDPSGAPLGTLTWIRSVASFDLVGELVDGTIWWDRAGAPLKSPSLGTHLVLDHPVDTVTGDLRLALCVDVSLGSHGFLRA